MKTRSLFLLLVAGLAIAVLVWSLSKAPVPSTVTHSPGPAEPARAQAAPQGKAANLQERAGSKESVGSNSEDHSPATHATNQAANHAATQGERESSAPLKTVKELLPNVNEMREEVAANPHLTPMAITRFSLALGRRLDALQSIQDGAAFMAELNGCVTDRDQRNERNIRSVQSLCILNARKTRNKFPDLEKQYQDVKKKADPAARAIEEALE